VEKLFTAPSISSHSQIGMIGSNKNHLKWSPTQDCALLSVGHERLDVVVEREVVIGRLAHLGALHHRTTSILREILPGSEYNEEESSNRINRWTH
jgi:hypothetical protein